MKRRTFLASLAAAAALRSVGQEPPAPAPIVDTHVHFWDPAHLRYSWLDGNALLNRPYLPADYFASAEPHRVDRLVFVQAACAPEQALDEVKWVTTLAAAEPRIAAIVADAPLERGDAAIASLDALREYPLVRGIRRMLQGEGDPEFCLRPDFVRGVQLLAPRNMSFDLGLRRDQLAVVTKLVDQCPEVAFMVNHCAVPDVRNKTSEPWKSELAELAKRPNVFCKLSGLATAADHAAWNVEDLRPYVEHVLHVFGFERTAFGSDWPVMLQATPLPRWVGTVAALTETISEDEKSRLFSKTGSGFYRL
jgi:L-fuconolactonase